MAFPRTYYDGNPEDRDFVGDFWSWLRDQPQDAWLLFARCANWDSADRIFAAMLDDPRCDRAVAAYIFWSAEPGSVVRKPASFKAGNLVHDAIERASRGRFTVGQLFLDRYDVVHGVQDYVFAVGAAGGSSPFLVPEQFFGPFEGRRARIAAAFDEATERELGEVLDGRLGWLPRSEEQFRESQRSGGNMWLAETMGLPVVPPAERLVAMPERERLEAIYGRNSEYREAREANAAMRAAASFTEAARAAGASRNWKRNPLVWLAIFAVVAIAGAFLARRLQTGGW